MADLSIAVLVGRLTRDAELKYTNGGQAICHFSVATSSRRKKGDQWVDEASFWDIDLWGKQGETLNQYLTKGKLVAVEGSMRQDRWEQDGQPRMKVVVSANSVQLLGSGQGNSAGGGYASSGAGADGNSGASPNAAAGGQASAREWQGRNPAQPAAPNSASSDTFSDDIPF
ncbi:MAG: single-stranded DNA-binding protein [Spirochaetes bacterium GWD1_61_31]|nr:MAG: single-stranded DNA-binding protein [Spirochaetes bacterium GWB1_60_80]OHD29637.1 MAG: single-stranded DNA-binding protein [Spirochaetes bacterium GWC1_61_12]OHD37542.1 MAG: single-stranded DNA-binding protein [Spirochaetes bacterium GWD1_61_31]OHD41948.1 MAG: single-stranded DNA-binding protein [Spirochaetes bacterium GWE1_60_18]OHD61785.1 MAG: single-stranded DNA-binding protein [Spirochaetes bacterium GWF1_60_12]